MLLDGEDIKSLNVRHLRRFIGVVNQEPVLFATTIAENIAFGKGHATQHEIEEAAKMANAHDFITNFPQVYKQSCFTQLYCMYCIYNEFIIRIIGVGSTCREANIQITFQRPDKTR